MVTSKILKHIGLRLDSWDGRPNSSVFQVGSSGLQTDLGAFVGSFGRLAQVKEEKAAGRELSLSPPSRAFFD